MFKRSFALIAALLGSQQVAAGHGPSPMDLAVLRAQERGDLAPLITRPGAGNRKDKNSGRMPKSSNSVANDKRAARRARNIAKRG